MDAVIYTRVSKLVGARSTGEQEKECRAWCDREGYPVRAVFCDDNISASRFTTKDRPEWHRVKESLRTGDILVVWEASRGYRDLEEFVALRNLCAELSVPLCYSGRVLDLTLGDDRFTGGLDALLAERESEQIKVRVLRGKRSAAAGGAFPGGKIPWGYRLTAPGVIEPDPVEAPRVREAVKRLLAGETQYAVHKWLLLDENAYTPSNPNNLRRSLAKPTYAGMRVHQGEEVGKGAWEPIITEEQHKQLTGKFDRQKAAFGWTYRPGPPEPKYLLSGIAICGRCDTPVRHVVRTKGRGKAYQCHHGHVSRLAAPIDRAVEAELFKVLAAVDPAKYDEDDPRVAQALKESREIEAELEEWMQAAERREVSPAAFARIEKKLLGQLAALRPQTVKHEREVGDVRVIATNWTKYTILQKRDVIRAFLTIKMQPADEGRRNGTLLIEPL